MFGLTRELSSFFFFVVVVVDLPRIFFKIVCCLVLKVFNVR